jgi:hypothetical protein
MAVAKTQAYYYRATISSRKKLNSMGFHSNGRLLAMPSNSRLGWKRMAVGNALAYYDAATLMVLYVFIVRDSTLMVGSQPFPQTLG